MADAPGGPSVSTQLAHERTDLAQQRVDLAEERTRLAYERTLMAWVRTSTALISFGFTLYKFFDVLQNDAVRQGRLIGPRGFALMMILTGMVALVLAVIDHRRHLKLLERPFGVHHRSLAELIAILVSALGIFGLLMVLFRW